MREKKKKAPKKYQRTLEVTLAGALVGIWACIMYMLAHPNIVEPQIVYGAAVETEAETETETEVFYSEEDLYLLSHLICGEVEGCDWEMKVAVGSVVLNRVADPRFPSTLREVIYQKNPLQYSCTVDGNFDKTPGEETVEAAKYLLENGSQLPGNVIFQAEFQQGSGLYKFLLAPNGRTEYFCYG